MSVDGINGKLPGVVVPFELRPVHSQETAGKKESAKREQDSWAVSQAGREFARVRKLVDAAPDFRLDRVNQLARQIEEGTYNVKGEIIADALIRKNLIDFEA